MAVIANFISGLANGVRRLLTVRGLAAPFTASSPRGSDDAARRSVSVWRNYLWPALATLLLTALATAILFSLSGVLASINLVSVVYLLPVLIAALRWGIWAALLAAIAGALAADFFFYPPIYSFRIDDPQNVADLIVFLIVAVVSGEMAARLRRREQNIRELYAFSERLAQCFNKSDLIRAVQDYLSQTLGRPTAFVEADVAQSEELNENSVPMTIWQAATAATPRDDVTPCTLFDRATRHFWLARRMLVGAIVYVAFVDLGLSTTASGNKLNRRIERAIAEAAENFARLDLAKAIEDARLQGQEATLKNAIVATMSHDLRTPLASILGAASVLDQVPAIAADARARSLVSTMQAEAARLDGDIQNLLEAAQIAAGVERRIPELVDPVDIIHEAISRRKNQLAGHRLEVSIVPNLPLIEVQPQLVENALAQLLDNAAKYSPTGSRIEINGSVDGNYIVLSVTDQGAGLTAPESHRVGQRSFRGARHAGTISGSGLGLWIASTFVAANGGKLEAESAGANRGTTIRIRFPTRSANGQG